ncbi:ATP-binding cassette domain-containing protein [Granulosicoccus sp. 3-233]|uniref:ATP-binding cassette domain-containing protein n=1 Tax=Granulosicoccus sp. 3-233 TaxID=3417969 RepID=UPI003D329DAF
MSVSHPARTSHSSTASLQNPGDTALDIHQVCFSYGNRQALDDVSIRIDAGERVMLLGANGAGKSTLFSLICGLFAADSGRISINGKQILRGAAALAPLGIVFQSQTLDLDLSVEQNLAYFCALHGIERKTARQRIELALQRLDLLDRRYHKVRTLNGGHRRRVEIARATLHEPGILLLDEPTVGLDIPTRTELIAYIRELPDTLGCAVLWATHLIDEIHENDRVLMLHQGRVHHDGPSQRLCHSAEVTDLSELMHQVMHP